MEPLIDFHALDGTDRLRFALGTPAALFVTGEDAIQLAAINSASGVTLTLAGRFVQLNGQVTSFSHTLTPTTDRVITTAARALGNGWILNFSVFASAGSPLTGQCWARVNLQRGLGGASMQIGTLTSGYVTTQEPIAYPGGALRDSLDGRGVIRSITGTDPAANTEFVETVPTGARWRFNALVVTFVTDATVGFRYPQLIIDDGATIQYISDPDNNQTASVTYRYNAGSGLRRLAPGVNAPLWALPNDVFLMAGWRIRSNTVGMQATDNYGAPQLLVEEWLEGN